MRAQLLHLSGPQRGRTVTYAGPVVTIGSREGCNEVLRAPGVAARHARIEFVEPECAFHLRAEGGVVFVNGSEIEEVILQDGDQIEFGVGGPVARFRIYVPIGAVCKPVRRMLADASDVGRRSGSIAATTALTRDLLTQATLTLKVGFPLFVVGVAVLAGLLGGWLGTRPAVARDRTADEITQAEIERLRGEQRRHKEELERLAQANETVRRIQREWSRGVCLLHGVFRLRRADGGWLELRGAPHDFEYTGSGFLATNQGHIVTNRHVAAPWRGDEGIAALVDSGMTPQFVTFTATFPGRAPIDVPTDSVQLRQDDLDVAVVKVPATSVDGVPVLPLQPAGTVDEDQRAIVVGYPTGLAALIARADNALVERLRQSSATMAQAIAELAAADQILPLLTQGIVSEVREHQITYDAVTTHGGSGGPVFGGNGKVIAVNYAILENYTGVNLGVPIRFASELLPQ